MNRVLVLGQRDHFFISLLFDIDAFSKVESRSWGHRDPCKCECITELGFFLGMLQRVLILELDEGFYLVEHRIIATLAHFTSRANLMLPWSLSIKNGLA